MRAFTEQELRKLKNKRRLVLMALWEAKLWEDSIEDAHTLDPWNQTDDLTKTARAARRLSRRFEKLHDELMGERYESKEE
jgi:hypothetical protein